MKNKFQKMNKSDLHYEVLKNLYQKGITPEDLDINQCYINENIYQLVSKDGTVISSVDLNQVFQETNSSNVIQTLALIFFSFLTVIALILFQELFRFGSFEEYNSNEDKEYECKGKDAYKELNTEVEKKSFLENCINE